MGNASTARKNSMVNEREENQIKKKIETTEIETSIPRNLSLQEIVHVKRTWKLLEEDIARVGVITFISLFETHPDVQQVFMPFKGMDLEDLKHSKQLRAHALRVMAFVQKAVARLEEPEKLEILLKELGKKHFNYKAKVEYVDLVGPQFLQAIQPSLKQEWSEEVSDAWKLLFAHVSYVMKKSMIEAKEEDHMAKQ